jgi:DNA-binding NarL/FixJ family response regulator
MITIGRPDLAPNRPSLMIADDDAVVRTVIATQLRERFEVVGFASDAAEAISIAEEHQPDAAIIDVEMPAGGGMRATSEIRRRAPRTAILILSVDEQRESVLRLLGAGAVCYARKGEPADALAAKISSSIAAHANNRCAS